MASKEPTQVDDSMMQGFVELPLAAEASGTNVTQDSVIDSHGHDTSIDHASDGSLERPASEGPHRSGCETGPPNTDPSTNGSSSVAGSPDSMLANAGSPPRALTPDLTNGNTHTDERASQMSDEGSVSSHEYELEQVGSHALEDACDSATEHPDTNGTFEMDP